MTRHIVTVKEAAQEWVREMNAIPQTVCAKLLELDPDDFYEITPPAVDQTVYLTDGDHAGESGTIVVSGYSKDPDLYKVELDSGLEVKVQRDELEYFRHDYFPMWGTMWSFGDSLDNWWLEEQGGLQKMADCGFRVYESEDYGYIFGIDGAGYDFYESHWIPLYRARGLHWHEAKEKEGCA
jgi:hypothetical protein